MDTPRQLPYTRDAQAQMAFGVFMACWRRGFVIVQHDGALDVQGYDDRYRKIARALVNQFRHVLALRAPSGVR